MTNALRDELLKLPPAERLALLEELWDSIPEPGTALAVTSEQYADLERRLAEADADPRGGLPWQEARNRIRRGR
jgi:putative addiction module component (TIGR02574 family)